MPRGIDGLESELLFRGGGPLEQQRPIDYLAAREPVYARLLELLQDAVRGEAGARLAAAWSEREFHSSYERPLLLLAGLRYDALSDAGAHPLHASLAQTPPDPASAIAVALAAALSPARTRFWSAVRERAVQTNETTRAVTWLWPLSLLASAGEQRSVVLVDLGTSAGLNLVADALPAAWSDADGAPIPVAPRLEVVLRIGFDIAPVDVSDEDAACWLRACVWPSDAARLARLNQAIACFRASSMHPNAPQLVACVLPDVPARLDALPREPLIVCVQSIVRDYLPAADCERYEHEMRAFLRRRPRAALWLELELDPAWKTSPTSSVAITARLAAAGGALRELVLARTTAHPQQLHLDPAAVAMLQAELINAPRRT
jgi:hypothetical protein